MALSASLKVILGANLTRVLDLASGGSPIQKNFLATLTDGAGANQADRIFHDQRTLAASATEDLDVAGSLLDIYGQAFTLARLKLLLITAAAGNTNNVNFSRAAANGVPLFAAASDAIPVRPGGCLVWCDPSATGIVVTAGTGDLLTFTNSAAGTSVTYDVVIIGAST